MASLKLAWTFESGVHGQFETSPVVVDGRMYFTTGPGNSVFALDAQSGALKWRYDPRPGRARYTFNVNRGVAVDGGRVFYNTLDDRLIALDARSGKVVWESRIGDPREGLSEDAAPLAWSGLVFVGSAGSDFGVRGSYSAYSQKDGKLVWRWWAVSPGWEGTFENSAHGIPLHRDIARERASLARYRDAWKNGGGAVWMTPALGTRESAIYLSTANPAPTFNADRRPGDNLYTESIVALDARSGKMKWYYQETPHDVWDYDASSPPVLIDALDAAGRRVPAVAEAGKTGWLYIVDRRTGRLLRVSAPFIPQPHVYQPLTAKGVQVEPGDVGGAIAPIAYDPGQHSAFVAGNIDPEIGQIFDVPAWNADSEEPWKGGEMAEIAAQHASSLLSSIDVDTGRIRWSSPVPHLIYGGPLSIGGLIFLGETGTGSFKAYDASNGRVLWNVQPDETAVAGSNIRDEVFHFVSAVERTAKEFLHRLSHQAVDGSADIHAPPIAYRMNGREYIVIATDVYQNSAHAGGNTIFAFSLP